LEFRIAARCVRRLAVALAVAGVMALTALPLLAAWLAEALDGRLGICRGGWLGIFGLALAAGGLAVALLAWWSFRRHFGAMAETLEECREDLVWLREWLRKS
jgi:MFS family permease